eukprot:CAMPEP_0170934464 /NCGR_PEP_ID=MMETSP0735-20130129/18368_1 /TAXON_ID=186038 /ORGANISM="Fragilariopsis kerguelensis, Strain L26-C5" /LENGTH=75 /DNA_ID=CAMNT_0011337687 /DNA_START=26 /DNA_END=253 /DNA_ORIENTATION=+
MMFKISSMLFFLVVAVAFSVTEGNLSGAAQEDIANDPRALRGKSKPKPKPKGGQPLKLHRELAMPKHDFWKWLWA